MLRQVGCEVLAGVAVRASTHVTISDNVFRGAKAPIIDRGENRDIRQWNNTIGWPMVVALLTNAAGPTPPYIRPLT